MTEFDQEGRTRAPDNGGVRQVAATAVDAAGTAASNTAGTAREQAAQVAGEAKAQARNLAHDVRDRVGAEARSQNDRLADGVRRFADELDEMVSNRGDSPASKVVTQVSQGGRRVADYLAEHGPEGVLDGVQDFARRRPGTFLLAAAAAGFVVGRLGKGVLNAADAEPTYPSTSDTASRAYGTSGYGTDTYATGGYGTETYGAETYGTGTIATTPAATNDPFATSPMAADTQRLTPPVPAQDTAYISTPEPFPASPAGRS